jgi:hypothetical protein
MAERPTKTQQFGCLIRWSSPVLLLSYFTGGQTQVLTRHLGFGATTAT